VFIDADVRVHQDTLRQFVEVFKREPNVSAVFGAYDLNPSAPGLVSQYRNLLHHYVHQRDAGEAVTFWAGCGAVRTAVFASCGGFDETEYATSSVEDIQLGYRLSGLGQRILLRPEIQGTHMKRWTLDSMIETDVWGRGVPWMRLLLSRKVRPTATLNLRPSEQFCTMLVVAACLSLVLWPSTGARIFLGIAVAGVSAMLVINMPLLAWFARQQGWWFTVRVIPLRILYYALNAISVFLGGYYWAMAGRPRAQGLKSHDSKPWLVE
jgi:cellulose synthase/poly-beta-1,6-N-acetylglucosamine synthase-like glycosyltransferase